MYALDRDRFRRGQKLAVVCPGSLSVEAVAACLGRDDVLDDHIPGIEAGRVIPIAVIGFEVKSTGIAVPVVGEVLNGELVTDGVARSPVHVPVKITIRELREIIHENLTSDDGRLLHVETGRHVHRSMVVDIRDLNGCPFSLDGA